MVRVGLLSDTHSYIHPGLIKHIKLCDEIWHAGDIGSFEIVSTLSKIKPLKAVYGNIDGEGIRKMFPEVMTFMCEQVKVMITHIGGYPGRYSKGIPELLSKEKPKLFITGHSHILKVMYDEDFQMLHINPGAAGKFGLHKVITFVKFVIEEDQVKDLQIVEFERN
jgi:putative phosphoesterase